ncbi:hypothetical protein As57867_006066, partial [Aphanomyces stellatus]
MTKPIDKHRPIFLAEIHACDWAVIKHSTMVQIPTLADQTTTTRSFAYATLVATDSYVVGAQVLRASLLAAGSPYPLVIMHTPSVSAAGIEQLEKLPNVQLFPVGLIAPAAAQATSYMFDRFKDVWTKLRVFELTQFETVVFLDADMLCTQRMDELFGLIDPAPDSLVASLACICNPMKLAHYPKSWVPSNCPYWQHEHGMPKSEDGPKYFNSGMMVLHP